MQNAHLAGGDRDIFALGWRKAPGGSSEIIGSVTLPNRPTTLGEARGGLQMIGGDEKTARWLSTWAESAGEERRILLRLPGGWYELEGATIAIVAGEREHYIVRFDRRSAKDEPAA
jgi:hypothetical protein